MANDKIDETDELRGMVLEAWRHEVPPKAEAIRREMGDVDTQAIIPRLQDGTIDELVLETDLLGDESVLVYGGPQTKRYFLQAYLLCALNEFEHAIDSGTKMYGPMAVTSLIGYFYDPKERGLQQDCFYSDLQRDVICRFIRFVERNADVFCVDSIRRSTAATADRVIESWHANCGYRLSS